MSEFKHDNRTGFRWALLTTVSAIALFGTAYGANASDNDRPPLWIELGGQFTQEQADEEVFSPDFLSASPFDAASHSGLDKTPPSSWDGSAKISFDPTGTDWVFSASLLYGKSTRGGLISQQTAHGSGHYGNVYQAYQIFAGRSSESRMVLDFQAGKDVGLGMFGRNGHSTVSLGVRYAQFESRSSASIRSQPSNIVVQIGSYHKFYASFAAQRKFTGVGPSLSWDASADLMGNPQASTLALDWGANAAILFGRQRTQIHHQTTNEKVVYRSSAHRTTFGSLFAHFPVAQTHASPSRNRQVTVPNLGGFAGISWNYSNAKVMLGYRADFFFGAMDGGIDTAKKENVGFYGPFASVSIGIGG
jgi:iron complex outermembrane receptor protein